MATTKVSLITTVFNCQKYLEESINSVIDQNFKDWELIIFDDGSTDNSKQIIEEYVKYNKRIIPIFHHHVGRPKALNIAIKKSKGEYIGLLDSDDVLIKDALYLTSNFLDKNPKTGMVYTQYYDFSENGEIIDIGKRCTIRYSKFRLLTDFMVFHFRLVRRNLMNLVGNFDENFLLAQDYDLCLKLSEITNIDQIKTPLYCYRKTPNSLSSKKIEQQKYAAIAINNALKRRNLNYSLHTNDDFSNFHLKEFIHRDNLQLQI